MTDYELSILYHLLAQSFSFPTGYFAEGLKRLVGELRIESWDCDSRGRPVLQMAPYIRVLATLNRLAVDQLQQEHYRLFQGGASTALCPVYAWAYLSNIPAEILTRDIRQIYAVWGWEVSPNRAAHLETELEFLAFLYRQVDDEAARLSRENFFARYTLAWLLRFAAAVTTATRSEFYRAAACLLADFLKLEALTQYKTSFDAFYSL